MQTISGNTSIGSEFVGIYNDNNNELLNKISALENRIKTLEAENTAMKKTVAAVQQKYGSLSDLNKKIDTIINSI